MKYFPYRFRNPGHRYLWLETVGSNETNPHSAELKNLSKEEFEKYMVSGQKDWMNVLQKANSKYSGKPLFQKEEVLNAFIVQVRGTMGMCNKTDALAILFDVDLNPFVAVKREGKYIRVDLPKEENKEIVEIKLEEGKYLWGYLHHKSGINITKDTSEMAQVRADLCKANGVTSVDSIKAGSVVKIPKYIFKLQDETIANSVVVEVKPEVAETNEDLKEGEITQVEYKGTAIACKVIKVKKGEWLWKIAREDFNYEEQDIKGLVEQIVEINKLKDDRAVKPGQILKIPVTNYSSEEISDVLSSEVSLEEKSSLATVFEEMKKLSSSYINLEEFETAFKKANNLSLDKPVNFETTKKYLFPGVRVIHLEKNENLKDGMTREGYFVGYDTCEEVFKFNQAVNPDFKNIKSDRGIKPEDDIWVPLDLLAVVREIEAPEDEESIAPDDADIEVQKKEWEKFSDYFEGIDVLNHDLENLYVSLDPGHGGDGDRTSFEVDDDNPGKKNKNSKLPWLPYTVEESWHLMNEHAIVYDVTIKLIKLLKENGAHVISTVINPNKKGGQNCTENPLLDHIPKDKKEGFAETKRQAKFINPKVDEVYSNFDNKNYCSDQHIKFVRERKKNNAGKWVEVFKIGEKDRDCQKRINVTQDFFRKQTSDANRAIVEIYLALHADDRQNPKKNGFCLYMPRKEVNSNFYNKQNSKQEQQDLEMAKILVEEIKKDGDIGLFSGGIKRDTNMYTMRGINKADARMYAEIGNMLGTIDSQKLQQDSYRQKIAEVIFKALVKQYKKEQKEAKKKRNR